ncbi:hypothetical protein CL631_00205 [bacterium]|nr:hypothetical protein [bacterium]|tara:strand:- start:918 stop:1109 length:192 start_codon:yes stop_codon:yes gene_type:complete
MTERFWTPERKKDYYKLVKAREHRRKYIREYMRKERKQGNYTKKWERKKYDALYDKLVKEGKA